MSRLSLTVLTLLACIAALVPASRAANAPGALEGQWTAVSASSRGEEMKGKDLASVNLTIKGDTLTFAKGGPVEKMAIAAIDPLKNPATIDLTMNDGKESSLGLFKLDKDNLELCFSSSFAKKAFARPAAIGSDKDVVYIRYTRAK